MVTLTGEKVHNFLRSLVGENSSVFENLVMSGGIPWGQAGVRGVPRDQRGHLRGTRGSKGAPGGRLKDPRFKGDV